jgi:putative flavoprotein involved in K+ transport
LKLPGLLDGDGFPIQQRGVTQAPGLYFLGLHCMHTLKSGLLFGVGEDAAHVAEHIQTRGKAC